MINLALDVPRIFKTLLEAPKNMRYLGAYGGRGSGKSFFFAQLIVLRCLQEDGLRVLCCREVQNSIENSSKLMIEDAIKTLNVEEYFDIQKTQINTPGGGVIIFKGLQSYTSASIKSLANFNIAWIEEAQTICQKSWDLLRPTIRSPGSQIWCSWNPLEPTDAIDKFFRVNPPDDAVVVEANWEDNIFFPEALKSERLHDLKTRDPAEYEHIWEGGYQTLSEAVIFRNISPEEEFEAPINARFYFGMDWGFANDPTAIVRCWIDKNDLYIDYAEGSVGIEMEDLPRLIFSIPDAPRWMIKADCARPETISYLARRNFRIEAAKKWQGSVEDGIERLKSFKTIHVHKRAHKIAKEFRLYSYKVEAKSGEVIPKVEDKNNHWIDALRYALDTIIQNERPLPDFSNYATQPIIKRRFI